MALWRFTRERFPLASHVPMVAVFALGNVAFAADAFRTVTLAPGRFAVVWLIGLLYFFRLRCFDEIKDYEVDRRDNPDRALARGVVTHLQLGRAIGAALVLELILAAALFGTTGLLIHGAAQAFSLLMYREFFIGGWLRTQLTIYAVTHTFSATLLGASLGMLHAAIGPRELNQRFFGALLFNWCLFNLFEFARKTWAPEEERPKVDSYSRRFGVPGAVLLAGTQVVGGVMLTLLHPRATAAGWAIGLQATIALLPLAAGATLLVWRTRRVAAVYRGVVSIYLVLFYAVLAAGHLRS
jgi:hypothetical protein